MEFVVVAVLFILAIVGLARPYVGLISLLIVMETNPGELYPSLAPFHVERIVAGLLLASFFIHGKKLRLPPVTRWFLVFYGAMIVSIPLAFWRGNSFHSCFTFLEVVVFVLFTVALVTTEKQIRTFVVVYVLLIDWIAASGLWNYMHGDWWVRMGIERVVGITSSGGDPDTLAATLVFTIPFCLALMVRSNPKWMRAVGLVSTALFLVTIVDTGSRAIAVTTVFLVALLLLRKPKNLLYIPVLLVLAPLIWMAIPEQYQQRYKTMHHLKHDASYQNRILSWEGGIRMFEHNPITGVGAGNYTDANGAKYWPSDQRKHYLNAHSLYFKLLGELGIVGIFAFGGYLICLFSLNLRLGKELRARGASRFLQELPAMLSITLLLMMFDGYAAHNLYRDTWYLIGALAASVSLLPVLALQPAEVPADHASESLSSVSADDWSPALLPALSKRPVETPVEATPASHVPIPVADWSPALLPALRDKLPSGNS